MPLLSVVMPVHNASQYLAVAVESTLRAMPRDSELRIHDDGSTDDTLAVAQSVGDPRIIISQGSNQGVASSLNALVRAGDSRYVARMDADDVCLPWRFRRQLKLQEHADLVFSSVLKKKGRLIRPEIAGRVDHVATPYHLLLASFLCHPTMMARRSALPNEPYRDVAAEDYDLWLRLVARGARIVRDWVPGLVYRMHPAQVSASPEWDAARTRWDHMEGTLEAYSSVRAACGLPARAWPAMVYFAESQKVAPEEADAVRAELGRISFAAHERLPRSQYALVAVRRKMLASRLA